MFLAKSFSDSIGPKTNHEIRYKLDIPLPIWWALTGRDMTASVVTELLGILAEGLFGLSFFRSVRLFY